MILYALKSALVLMLLYSCFFALMSRETFHRLNRALLLATLGLSLCVPFVQITVEHPLPIVQDIMEFGIDDYSEATIATALPSSPASATISQPWWEHISWPVALSIIYFGGVLAMLLFTIVRFIQLAVFLRGGLRHTDEHGNTIILKSGDIAPFSLFRTIVMSVGDYEHNRAAVLTHEQEHIRLRHTYDLLLLGVVKTLQWFNPFVWLLGRDLRAIHEYEADEAVINQGIDAKQYQLLLVTKAVGYRLQPLANNLRRGSLKKRMIMMYQKKSNRAMMLKALFVLPATALSLYAFASPEVQQAVTAIDNADPTAAVVDKVVAPVAATISSAESTKNTCTPAVNSESLQSDDNTPDTSTFKCADIAKALEKLHPDDNTLFMIDNEVLSRQEFMKRASQMTFNDISGTGAWTGLGVAAGELGEVAKGYKKAFRLTTRDYYNAKSGSIDENYVFTNPEVAAQYPGGEAALMKQIVKLLHYPTYAMENDISGQVVLQVVVEKDGSIGPIKVQQGLEERCNAEAILAASKLGKFTPAKQQGKAVRSFLTIPVRFSIQ